MFIFVGLLYSDKKRKEIISKVKTPLESAANAYQWGLINGLKTTYNGQIEIINSVPMGSFPNHSKVLSEKSYIETENEIEINNLGYINLPLIKQKQRTHKLYKTLKKKLKESKEPTTIVVYSLYLPYLKALKKIKTKFASTQYLLIVPDLPCQYGIESTNKIKRWLNRRIGKKSLCLSSIADGYILLTEQMNDVINKGEKPYQIIEGIGTTRELNATPNTSTSPIILYTGSLNRIFGIDKLVNAFLLMPKNSAELWIAGAGDMQEELKDLSQKNSAVKYLGYCSKEQIIKMQNEASILVNPRSAMDEYAKYSFPSKTMEYLSTGKPVAMNKLPGLPEEYNEHLFYFTEETPEAMAHTFEKILSLSKKDLQKKKQEQLDFISNQKSGKFLANKIIKLRKDFYKG